MDIAQFVRDSAARGLSKTATRQALGYSWGSFEAALELIGPVDWPSRGCSHLHRLAFERPSEARRAAQRSAIAKAREVRSAALRREVRGVVGNVAELVAHFGVAVSAGTVRRRISEGMTLEAALFTPRQGFGGPLRVKK